MANDETKNAFEHWWAEFEVQVNMFQLTPKETAQAVWLIASDYAWRKERAAQQSVQPTVLTHAPNCALVQSLVAECNCHLAKSHSG